MKVALKNLPWLFALMPRGGGSLSEAVSRLEAIADASATLETYQYLGLGTVVTRGHPQNGVEMSFVKKPSEPVGDAGDQYTGLDRFGRVSEVRWVKGTPGPVAPPVLPAGLVRGRWMEPDCGAMA